jgi:cytochrome c553
MKKNLINMATMLVVVFALSACSSGNPEVGKQKAATCAACHGADGNSTNPQFPRLAGQYEDYIVNALMDYKSGARKNPIMKGMAANLSAADIADLAAYFSSQPNGLFVKK